jgi:hypothetical protein
LEKPNLICDNFYLFPFAYLKDFYTIANKNALTSFHCILNDIEKIENVEFVNYILNENKRIPELTFYTIYRVILFKN